MIKYVQYSEVYYERTIDFLKNEWKSIDTGKWEKYFTWKFLENPYIQRPIVFLAIDDERIVGFRGIFVQKFVCNSTEILVGSGAEARVVATHQGRGIYRKLIELCDDCCEKNNILYQLSLSSNLKSTPILIKLGWHPVRVKRELIKVSIRSFIPTNRNTGENRNIYKYRNIIIKEYSGDRLLSGETVDALVESSRRNKSSYKIQSMRDKIFYKYKLSNPLSDFIVYSINQDSNLSGHIILKRLTSKKMITINISLFKIMEFRVSSNALNDVINIFLSVICRRSSMLRNSIISVPHLTMDKSLEDNFKKRGFIKENKLSDLLTGRKSLPFLVKPTENNDAAWYIDNKSIKNYSHWDLTGLDVDNA